MAGILACSIAVPFLALAAWRLPSYRRRMDEQYRALRESEERFRATFEQAPVGIAHTSIDGRWLLANRRLCDLYGYTLEELFERRFQDITHPDDLEHDLSQLRRLLDGELSRYALEKRFIRKDGRIVWANVTVSAVRGPSGRPKYTIAVVEDITSRKRMADALRASEERYRELVEASPNSILVTDLSGTILTLNRQAADLYGCSGPEDLVGTSAFDLLAPEERTRARLVARKVVATGRARRHAEYTIVKHEGTRFPAELSGSVLMDGDGKPEGFIVVAQDITERKKLEIQLKHQALHDALTGLPNRTVLRDRLQQAILTARRSGSQLALLLMDLDRFKEINDAFGHHYGDLVLQQVAHRLQRVLRDSDTIARLGGDEFAVLLPLADERGAIFTACKVLQAFTQSYDLDTERFEVGTSIGISVFPEHGDDGATLLRHADVAMYTAKRGNVGYAVYTADQDENVPHRLTLTAELRTAIEQGGLLLHYQPKVDMLTGRVHGVEALVRWPHPDRGLIPPDQVVVLAEHTGLIYLLSRWVLNEALRQSHIWSEAGFEIHIAVNLSAQNLRDDHLAREIGDLLQTWGVDPSRLHLEVTESAVMVDPAHTGRVLARLHAHGLHIAIDDFGTGYSSLANLKRLPVDEIKIDKSFILDMGRSDEDLFIVRTIVELGHSLGLKVLAEGVENQKVLDLLRAMGCDLAQGYYLSRPLDPDELVRRLRPSSLPGGRRVGVEKAAL